MLALWKTVRNRIFFRETNPKYIICVSCLSFPTVALYEYHYYFSQADKNWQRVDRVGIFFTLLTQ